MNRSAFRFGDVVQTPEGRGVVVRVPYDAGPFLSRDSGEDGIVEVALDGAELMISGTESRPVQRGKRFPAELVTKRPPVDTSLDLEPFLSTHSRRGWKPFRTPRPSLRPKSLPAPKVNAVSVGDIVVGRAEPNRAALATSSSAAPLRSPALPGAR